MRVLRAAERKATPWKNGGGTTREIAAFPPDATFDDFAWRLSMATVDASGPFSRFPNIDRTLTVLKGKMTLSTTDAASVTLSSVSSPYPFAGEQVTDAVVVEGPVLDLNVMTRRGQFSATVSRVSASSQWDPDAASVAADMLFAESDGTEIINGSRCIALDRHDAVLFEHGFQQAVFANLKIGATMLHISIRHENRSSA